jgi:hypothetical protein
MTGTFEGLSVPLYGGYYRYTEAGVQTLRVRDGGLIYQNVLHNDALTAELGVTYMEAVHLQTNISTTTGGSDALWVGMFHDSGTCNGQVYCAEFWLQGASGASVGGGRTACINLIINHDSSYGQVDAATSYINFTAVDALVPALFTLTGETVAGSGGCVVAKAAAASTQGLRIYIANAVYYIMVTSCPGA